MKNIFLYSLIISSFLLTSCKRKLENTLTTNNSMSTNHHLKKVINDSTFLLKNNRNLFKYQNFVDSFNFDISPLNNIYTSFSETKMLEPQEMISIFQEDGFTDTWETWLYSIQKETRNYFAITIVINSEAKFRNVSLSTYNSKTGKLIDWNTIATRGGEVYHYNANTFFINDSTFILNSSDVDYLDYNESTDKELVYKIEVKEKIVIDYNGFLKRVDLIDSTYSTYYID